MYYGETVLNSIGEEAFWRENDSGDTLYIGYIIGYPKSSVPFYDYDWAGSNRNNKYFYDLYGIYSDTPRSRWHHECAGHFRHLNWLDYRQLPVVWEVFIPRNIRRSRTFLAWSCQL